MGNRRARTTVFNSNFAETANSSNYSGKLAFRSKSALLHPNFMVLDLDVEVQPGSQSDAYLVAPNRSETSLHNHGRVHIALFQKQPASASFYYNLSTSLINRELLTSVKNRTRTWGTTASIRNHFLPVRFSYNASTSDETELFSQREFRNQRTTTRVAADRSFTTFDNTRVSYSILDYTYNYRSVATIRNNIHTLDARNQIYFNKQKKSFLNSFFINNRQTGFSSFNQTRLTQMLRFELPWKFQFTADLLYSKYDQNSYFLNQNRKGVELAHQLFASLKSSVFWSETATQQTAYNEDFSERGFSFDYKKRIPTGNFSFRYAQTSTDRSQASLLAELPVMNEQHRLADEDIIWLKQPFVVRNSIQITDESQTFLFQEFFDYILIDRGQYVEIQRLPGGQISNGQTVLVDYKAAQQPSYNYNSTNENLNVNISLFKRLVTLYTRYSALRYNNLQSDAPVLLNRFVRRVYGINSFYKGFEVGAETDDYDSNILPYTLNHYFIAMSSTYFRRLNLAIRGNQREYQYTEEMRKQFLTDVMGKIIFYTSGFKISLSGDYRLQNGRGLDLELLSYRSELAFQYYGLHFLIGYENYNRVVFSENIQFSGGYFRIERNF